MTCRRHWSGLLARSTAAGGNFAIRCLGGGGQRIRWADPTNRTGDHLLGDCAVPWRRGRSVCGDLYAQGWTLRQIGAELGVTATTVSQQLRRAGVTMRRGGPPSHPASTQQILELRDRGLTWNETAEQVDMTVSGAWSRYRRARPPKSPRLGRWQQVLADARRRTLRLVFERRLLILSDGLPLGLS